VSEALRGGYLRIDHHLAVVRPRRQIRERLVRIASSAGSSAPFSLSAASPSQVMLEFVTPVPAWDVTMTSIFVSGVSVNATAVRVVDRSWFTEANPAPRANGCRHGRPAGLFDQAGKVAKRAQG
jgi:hypothetical protein